MEDAITQDVVSQEHSEQASDSLETAWGTLFPFAKNYPHLSLTDDSYTLGRQAKVVLVPSCAYYTSISKVHFEIKKESDKVILLDKSANGTFVDGVRIGKNKSVVISDDCEISLCCKKNKAFIFKDLTDKRPSYPSIVSNKYKITRKIGSGAYGEVKLAFKCETHEKFAVKIIDKKTFALPGKTMSIDTEAEILRQLSHPCIIKFEDAIDTGDKLFIFMELVEGGELFDRVITIKQFSDKEAKILFYQMVLAIKYLHDHNICHRDLKPENILLATDENITLIKVTDFGLSKFIDGNTVLRTMCGTPNYLAPEVLLSAGTVAYTPLCDVWSLGVILFICLVGYPPFTEERTDIPLKDQIIGGKVDFPRAFWKDVCQDACNLVRRMLTINPTERISIREILDHPWLKFDKEVKEKVRELMYPIEHGTTIEDISADNLTGEPILKKKKF